MEAGLQPELGESSVYEIKHSDELGRYLVATRDIAERSLIICERPFVCGPADDDRNMEVGEIPMCLGCFKRMTYNPWRRCTKCSWPICSSECEIAEYHAENECQVFISNNVAYPCRHTWPVVNKSILVLRTLLLKSKSPSLWQEVILKLEHHTEIRQTKPYCVKGDEMLLDNLSDFLNDCGYELEEEIIRVSGIINVNAFSTMKSDFQGNRVRIVQCMYKQSCLLAHSCIPNASWSIDNTDNLCISIRAVTPIKKGEMITIAYNLQETMSGTLHRIISTEDVAHFSCGCKRCADPTELGTYASAIKCFDCENDYLLAKNPTNPDSEWRCCGCDSVQRVPKIVLFLNNIEDSYENIKTRHYPREIEMKKLEIFLKQEKELLHENHYILQEVRMQIINTQIHSLEYLDELQLQRFVNHCKFMLNIADVLMPGFSRTRALLQFFLSQGLLKKASRMENIPNGAEEPARLYKDIHYLQTRALLYFKNYHSQSPGAEVNQFAARIQRQLKQLENLYD